MCLLDVDAAGFVFAVIRVAGADLGKASFDAAGASGESTSPRPCAAPSGMSSSSSDALDNVACNVAASEDDCVDEEPTVSDGRAGGTNAARSDCDMSEIRPDARRWLLVNLHHKLR
jgi:hypothetical protein